MSFLYPLGLLGLIGVPVLIIIYIIKNKYTEQTIPSTYLWELSEKFLKRKNPISRINGLISLILQILIVICISLATARPVFALKGQARDYCFILDGSGSMNIEKDGVSRFERGKEKISALISGAKNGSSFTLICTGETTSVVFKDFTDSERALEMLSETKASQGTADYADALEEAQKYFDENASLKVYLFSDKTFENVQNAEYINLSESETNRALLGAQVNTDVDGNMVVEGNAIVYGDTAEVTVAVYRNNSGTPIGRSTVTVKGVADPVAIPEDKTDFNDKILEKSTAFSVNCGGSKEYQSLRVVLEGEDALVSDDEIIIYNVKHDTSFRTLIVSDAPVFLDTALTALGYGGEDQLQIMKTKDYSGDETGYGLYIFDSYTPAAVPKDGAVWFFAPGGRIEDSGFIYQSEVAEVTKLTPNSSSSTSVKKLLEGVWLQEEVLPSVAKYSKCSFSRDFVTLFECNGNPVIFAGENARGNRQAVFAFALGDSDITATPNFLVLIRNLLNYTFPVIVEDANYFCGDVVKINVLPNCAGIRITSPGGQVTYADTETAVSEYTLSETGLYTIVVKIGETDATASERTVEIFSQTPYEESIVSAEEKDFLLSGEPSGVNPDGIYENLAILFIILAAFFVADWMVYCYEQYQLR